MPPQWQAQTSFRIFAATAGSLSCLRGEPGRRSGPQAAIGNWQGFLKREGPRFADAGLVTAKNDADFGLTR